MWEENKLRTERTKLEEFVRSILQYDTTEFIINNLPSLLKLT